MMYRNGILNKSIYGIIVAVLATFADATAANVVPRPSSTTAKASASRPTSAASRMPTMSVKTGSGSSSKGTSTSNSSSTSNSTSSSSSTTTTTTTTTSSSSQQTQKKEEFVADTSKVENKASQFSTTLSSQSSSELDSSATTLAELVRIQRAALDAADTVSAAKVMATDLSGTGENACDSMLRECMIQKCGSNFGKCVADTDTTFFDKMDTCRRTTNCTGHEYQLLSAEIKADRDLNAKLAVYNATIDCGNNYDTCIIAQCGATYSKCIGKSAGDEAIRKCENIAKSCVEYDSGLAMRTMSVFGEVRQNAERQIATDERRLYDLREQMRSVCTRLGAMFDERSLDCVYTVNFYANGDSTLYASKKAYAGSTFDCTQNWFGIDITTFRENAFRATRAQTAASSAMLGSGVGQAVGALTSGAIDRAIDRYKAEKDYDAALKECMEDGDMTEEECNAKVGTLDETDTDKEEGTKKGSTKTMDELSKQTNQISNSLHSNELQKICEGSKGGIKGTWLSSQNTCACPDPSKQHFDKEYGCISFNSNFNPSSLGTTTLTSGQFIAEDESTIFAKGANLTDLDKAYDPATGSFDVTVLDAITNEPVYAYATSYTGSYPYVADSTDEDGKITITLTKNLNVDVRFSAKGYDSYEKNINDIPRIVHMTEGRAYSADTKRLAGYVVDETDIHTNIAGVTIIVGDNQTTNQTKDTGFYRINDVAPDTTITFTHEDYESASYTAKDVPEVVKLKKNLAKIAESDITKAAAEASKAATEAYPPECYDGKLWHTLSRMVGMHDELSHGIHQPETLGRYQNELNRIKRICEQNQGEYKQTQRSVRDYDMSTPKNVCGTYNQYIMHTCEFGTRNNNGMKCHALFGQKVGNEIEVSYSYSAAARAAGAEKSGKNYDACEFAYSPSRK